MSTHSAFQSNATNAWNFNGTNGNLNTNNARINSNASRLLRDFCERVKERRDLPPLTIQVPWDERYLFLRGHEVSSHYHLDGISKVIEVSAGLAQLQHLALQVIDPTRAVDGQARIMGLGQGSFSERIALPFRDRAA